MMRFVRSICAAVALLASAASAFSQSSILQGGAWTPGHSPMYVGQGQSQPIVQDSGPAGGGSIGLGLSEQLLSVRSPTNTYPAANAGTGPLGTNWCDYDAPITNSTGYHVLCLGPNSNGGGMIYYGFGGGASPLPFTFNFNGASYQFPFAVGGIVGPSTSTVGDLAVWNNTTGTLVKDLPLSTVCSSALFSSTIAGCVPGSGGGTTNFLRADGTFAPPAAAGTTGQIQYNNAGVLGGFTASGDATVNTGTGAVTLATVNSTVGTFASTCVSLTANGKGLLTSIIRGICGISTQTANYSIATTDCGSIIVESGGPNTVTLPSASGFSQGCVVKLCNTNANDASHHAVLLSGFPLPLHPRLWMGMCLEVTVAGGAWTATVAPTRFVPAFVPTLFLLPNGNDANDGLGAYSTSNSIATLAQCFSILQNEMDLNGGVPACNLQGGGVFSSAGTTFSRGGTGIGVIYVIGDGGIATLRTTGNLVLEQYDFAGYLIFSNIQFDCSFAGSHPCFGLFLHQQTGVDLASASPAANPNYFNGGGTGDLAIWCDSQCKINSAQPINFSGTWGTGLRLDLASVASINSGMNVAGASFGGALMQMSGGSQLLWSGTLALGSSFPASRLFYVSNAAAFLSTFTTTGTAGGSTQSYLVINNGILCNAGSAIPGTTGATTTSGAASGIVPAGSGATCSP